MSASLDELRREIDAIDVALHDLLLRRTQIVTQIAGQKPSGRPAIRPGREAEIARRLVARHEGPFPVQALVRIWREMISALTRMQSPLAIAVVARDDQRSPLWDLARDHFGSATPMLAVNTPMAALRAVSEGNATIAVVPWPDEGDAEPWWRTLFNEDAKTPRIIARLPFLRAVGREGPDALAVAAVPLEATGDDQTLLGIELGQDVSRGRLKDCLEAAGLVTGQFRTVHLPGGGGSAHLVEVGDYVAADDPRLALLADRLGEALIRALPIGAYATPMTIPKA
ncbi:chorismate mutase [Oleisolibacter albus]|uniref:chorismate mutase n=1 Tax=Oleisolibacter albus TaxID=2171757 RepID=UPI000DF48C8B|nr:chorismate mutase [Oleisolibacter albus]